MLERIQQFISVIRPLDIADIILVAYIIFMGIKLVKETRAVQLIKGLLVLIVITELSRLFSLNTTYYIMRNTMQVGVVALLVVFQPELRRILEKVGRTSFGLMVGSEDMDTLEQSINEIAKSVEYLTKNRVGALIVIERDTKIGDIIRTGTELNANISSELLVNIFFPNSPLHDGAVIIRENKIKAAGCLLPLTLNENLSSELGTRHRAGIGISENSDAVIVIVSEETGKISFARNGDMSRSLTIDTLKLALHKTLDPNNRNGAKKFWKERVKWVK